MQGTRKVFVAYGDSDAMCDALGVSLSWLHNAAKNEGTLKGLSVYSYWTNRKKKLSEEEMAALAVDALSDETRRRLKALIRKSGV